MAALCVTGVGTVAAIDWLTGPDLQVLLLYLAPVVASAWYIGPRTGTAFAVATAAATLTIAILTPGGHAVWIACVNAGLRLALLLLALRVVEAERRHLGTIVAAADTDPLTNALNRRAFSAAVVPHLSVRGASAGTLLYLDVDGLKRLNDEEGHDAGDQHLVALADIIRRSIRGEDHFARLGGDEFAVFLTGQDVPAAHEIAARLLATCAARTEAPIRLSIGIAGTDPDDVGTIEPLLRRADDVMYDAKRSGGGVRVERRSVPMPPIS